jgi:N-acetylglucosamine kinase-like BadF-type ATPase
MKQVVYSVMGLTGCDTKLQYKNLFDIAKRLGFEQFTLANDAYLGIPAGNPKGFGICGINGTGCSLAGINQKGEMLQIGGVGYVSADYGGGGILSRQVVSTVYCELFRKGPPTKMTPILFEKLGITDKHDFVDKMYDKIADGSYYKFNLAKLLFEAAMENDHVASQLLRDIGISYAGGMSCMIDELQFDREEELPIIFAGSVFVKGAHPLLIDTIKEIINKNHPEYNIKYVKLEVPPVAGAVVWAFNKLGKSNYFNKINAQLINL